MCNCHLKLLLTTRNLHMYSRIIPDGRKSLSAIRNPNHNSSKNSSKNEKSELSLESLRSSPHKWNACLNTHKCHVTQSDWSQAQQGLLSPLKGSSPFSWVWCRQIAGRDSVNLVDPYVRVTGWMTKHRGSPDQESHTYFRRLSRLA